MKIRLNRMAWPVTALGPGRRAAVWVQGCTIGCHGCASRDTWDATTGTVDSVTGVLDWIGELSEPIDGLTISGGEPLQQPDATAALIEGARKRWPESDILMFTGYSRAYLSRNPQLWSIVEACDAVVAGPYVPRAGYGDWLRGSDNQELLVLTDVARHRLRDPPAAPRLQVITEADRVTLIGIPRPGDLEALTGNLPGTDEEDWESTWKP